MVAKSHLHTSHMAGEVNKKLTRITGTDWELDSDGCHHICLSEHADAMADLFDAHNIYAIAEGDELRIPVAEQERIMKLRAGLDSFKPSLPQAPTPPAAPEKPAPTKAATIKPKAVPVALEPLTQEAMLKKLNGYSDAKWTLDTAPSSATCGLLVTPTYRSKSEAESKQHACAHKGLNSTVECIHQHYLLSTTLDEAERFVDKRRARAAEKNTGVSR